MLLAGVFLMCLSAMSLSARAGLARLLTDYGRISLHAEPTVAAQHINSSDPEAQAVRAIVADEAGQPATAVAALQEALAQRPRDYWLWLELGRLQADNGAAPAALQASQEAVRRAPFYALPRWQLGNMLWRAGRTGEAWPELRRAVLSDPGLLPAALALAWQSYPNNTQAVKQALALNNPAEQVVWAQFLLEHGQLAEANKVYAGLGNTGRDAQAALLLRLLQQEQYTAAYAVWTALDTANGRGPLADGDFEDLSEISDEPGFGWRVPSAGGYDYELTESSAAHGNTSLRLIFNGNSEPGVPVLTQLLPVTAEGRYVLSFSARSDKILTGGLPVVTIRMPGRAQKTVLAQITIPPQTAGWQPGELAFTVPAGVATVMLTVQRQNCPKNPCPCFGQLGLDNFTLRRI